MIFRTLIAPAFAAMSALQPVAAMQQVPAGFAYVNNSDEGDLYFIKQVAKSGDLQFTQIHAIAPDGDAYTVTYTFNCATRQYKSGDQWKSPNPNTVGVEWMDQSCN